MISAVSEEDASDYGEVGERSEEDRDTWRLRLQLLGGLGVVAVLGSWWANVTGRMEWPSSPPLPLQL